MNIQPSPRIIGSFVIGFALVAGSYVLSNFGQSPGIYQTDQNVRSTQQATILRTAIIVSDENRNGVEDWRDEFIVPPAETTSGVSSNEPYTLPDSITGQAGIGFIQDILASKTTGGVVGGDSTKLIENTIITLEQQTSVDIYDTPNITIIDEWDAPSIRTYANAVATAIIENNQTDLDTELLILQDSLNRRDESRIEEIHTLAELYRLTRDAIVDIPVPAQLIKEHLDVINTLHAVHNDVLAMTYSYDDPAYALLRVKRYEDDVVGMTMALQNLYLALEPYASLFTPSDPAVFLTEFNRSNTSVNRIRI